MAYGGTAEMADGTVATHSAVGVNDCFLCPASLGALLGELRRGLKHSGCRVIISGDDELHQIFEWVSVDAIGRHRRSPSTEISIRVRLPSCRVHIKAVPRGSARSFVDVSLLCTVTMKPSLPDRMALLYYWFVLRSLERNTRIRMRVCSTASANWWMFGRLPLNPTAVDDVLLISAGAGFVGGQE